MTVPVRADDVACRSDLAKLGDAERHPFAAEAEPIEIRVDLGPAGTIPEGAGVDVKRCHDVESLEHRQRPPKRPIIVVEAEEHDPILRRRERIWADEPVTDVLEMFDHRVEGRPCMVLDVVKVKRGLARQRVTAAQRAPGES